MTPSSEKDIIPYMYNITILIHRDYEPRLVCIEKKDALGISIAAGCHGGVFVCSVNEGSIAAEAGLKYGDQLLEVK